MSMVDRQRYRQHSYVDGGSSTLSSTQLCRWWIVNVIVNRVMSMVDRQLSSVSAQDVGESQVIDDRDVIPSAISDD